MVRKIKITALNSYLSRKHPAIAIRFVHHDNNCPTCNHHRQEPRARKVTKKKCAWLSSSISDDDDHHHEISYTYCTCKIFLYYYIFILYR